MRLLDVEAVLDRERNIRRVKREIEILKELDDKSTSYAILSHRWGIEVTYDEMTGLTAMKPRKRNDVRERDGYQKIIKSCERAKKDGYRWLWIDTCCIDKRSSSELSEAINSMYRWYHNSEMCYVYLHDVDEPSFPAKQDFSRFGKSNGWPEWFSRGWTLQELIAPENAQFFNKDWLPIGTKEKLVSKLEDITRIPKLVLSWGEVPRDKLYQRPCIAQIMSWAADRKTARLEDRAYSLLGLFGVNMPMLYGEGSKAFQRLQLEIIRTSSDHSILAWNRKAQPMLYGSVLARDPSYFRGCHNIKNVDASLFVEKVKKCIGEGEPVVAADQDDLLSFYNSVDSTRLLRWDVTNLGIHVSLPVLSDRYEDYIYEAILPCRDCHGNLITIGLASNGPRSRHTYLPFDIYPTYACPEFRSLYLDCFEEPEEIWDEVPLALRDGDTSSCGFTRCGTFRRTEVAGDTVTFSSGGDTLIVLVYANDDTRCRFAVGLGYYLGELWGCVVCDESSAQQEACSSWADFAKQAYDIMWNAPISKSSDNTKDVHLPQTVFHVEIAQESRETVIRIEQCPGCCGEYAEQSADELYPSPIYGGYQLQPSGQELVECSGQRIKLGDYGDFVDGIFICRGNIFNHVEQLRIAPSAYKPVISPVSSDLYVPGQVHTQHDVATASSFENKIVLHQPRNVSLPNNKDFGLLLRALSTRLACYGLVTTVIECSEFYKVDCNARRMVAEEGEGKWSAGSGPFTPLCFITFPRPWIPRCARRQQFKRIREHFYAVADMVLLSARLRALC
ncbi:heterokaryon incompatibility protein-domain-containing protein [Pisolithus croceorrhizus]|nr:heterokaryon incompatibility protein-domain-containing protein [Pisolithus croceorrhizus]KAI6167832.1 heterokaryon incompatibility protein-domain-containing protein [Pisolithus thermaeus]